MAGSCGGYNSNYEYDINQRLENLDIGPDWFNFRISEHLDELLLDSICKRLDTEGAIIKNWRHLGAYLGIKTIDLDTMKNAYIAMKSPSRLLFGKLFAEFPDISFKKLLEILEKKMQRNDVVEEITEYMKSKQEERAQRIEHDEQPPFNGSRDVEDSGIPPADVTQNHCRDLAQYLSSDWRAFLRQCHLGTKINDIEEVNTQLNEKSYQALLCWRESTHNLGSIAVLKELFGKINRRDLKHNFDALTRRGTSPVSLRGRDGPVEDYVIHSLAEEIGVDWKWVMRHLDMDEQRIRSIDAQYNQLDDKVFQGIKKWTHTLGNSATLVKLATSLRDAGKQPLIRTLERASQECG